MLDVMPFDETSETELALHVSEEQAVGFNRLLHRTRRKKSAMRHNRTACTYENIRI